MVGVQIQRIDGKRISIWTMIKRHLISAFVYLTPLLIGAIILTFLNDGPLRAIMTFNEIN
ncbi:hypothetical protein FBF83_04740 [Pseudalkalibacillus hwajinpoensis]|uniref:ABC transporter permease n=2 Tax=Guptibacillus hwajinpoensis TaxID=208199 RepID=A0A4U1MNP7_9BACL|nr:hypothetical protein FBF83_04740 [Pseudalkalibacillus hwajinpoensis]